MKALCITGVIPKQLEQVAGILQQAGMTPAAPSKHDNTINVSYWLDQVLEASEAESTRQHRRYLFVALADYDTDTNHLVRSKNTV